MWYEVWHYLCLLILCFFCRPHLGPSHWRSCFSASHSDACGHPQSASFAKGWWLAHFWPGAHSSVGSFASLSASLAGKLFLFLCLFFFLELKGDTPFVDLGDDLPFTASVVRPLYFFMCLLSLCPDVKTPSRHFPHP